VTVENQGGAKVEKPPLPQGDEDDSANIKKVVLFFLL
jgi:hypothetical protein